MKNELDIYLLLEDVYASWIRNALLILVATLAIFNITTEHYLLHRSTIILLVLSSLLMIIFSTYDYIKRFNENIKNMEKPTIYYISLYTVIIWCLILLTLLFHKLNIK